MDSPVLVVSDVKRSRAIHKILNLCKNDDIPGVIKLLHSAGDISRDVLEEMYEKCGMEITTDDISSEAFIHDYIRCDTKSVCKRMVVAALTGDLDSVKMLKMHGALNLNAAMIAAAKGGHSEIIAYVIDEDARAYDKSIIAASRHGHLDILKQLLHNTMLCKLPPRYEVIPEAIVKACKGGHIDILRFFIPMREMNFDRTAFHAGRNGRMDILDLLVEINAENRDSVWLMRYAANGVCCSGNMELLLKLWPTLKANKWYYCNFMFYAGTGGNIDLIKFLLSHDDGSNIQRQKENLEYLLVGGADGNHIEVIKLVQSLDNVGIELEAACERAAARGNHDIVKLLIHMGATNYNIVMLLSAINGDVEMVELMLKLGADDIADAANYAARGGYLNIIELLGDRGTLNYDTLIYNAASGGHMDIIEFVGGTSLPNEPMYAASVNGHINVVKFMLEKGGNIFNRCLIAAVEGEHTDVMVLMMQKGADNNDAVRAIARINGHHHLLPTINFFDRSFD